MPSFPQAHNRLVCLDRVANILDAFRQCFPDKNPVTDRLTVHDLDDGRLLAIQKAAITAAAGLFPAAGGLHGNACRGGRAAATAP
jgi:hypothetical protein